MGSSSDLGWDQDPEGAASGIVTIRGGGSRGWRVARPRRQVIGPVRASLSQHHETFKPRNFEVLENVQMHESLVFELSQYLYK